MKKIFYIVSFFALIVLPSALYAGPIIRTGDKISIDSAQVLEGDFYGFAPSLTLSGIAKEDVYITGGTVTINAPVNGDLTVVGGVVQIHGDVGGDLRVLGGEVTVGNTVKEDVAIVGGTLVVLSTAIVEGDLLFMGGDLTLEGDVAGSVHGSSDTFRIDGHVGGDVLFDTVRSFTLGDKTEVQGAITYESALEIIRAQNATVGGEIRRVDSRIETQSNTLSTYLFGLCILLFISLVLYLLGRRHIETILAQEKNSIGVLGLVGLCVFLIVPFISVVLMVSVIGILAGIALLTAYAFTLIIAFGGAGIMLGVFLQKLLTKKSALTLGTVFLGVVVYTLLGLVPFVGPVILLGGIIIMLGGISMTVYRLLRS